MSQKLSIKDPIDAATLQKFKQFQLARSEVALRLLDLEQEKVRTLRAAAAVDADRAKLFESVLVERGLAPTTAVEIDANTGMIHPVGDQPEEPSGP